MIQHLFEGQKMSKVTPEKPADPALAPIVCDVFEAARLIGYSVQWMAKARMTGRGPKFIKMPRKVLYRIEELHRWLAAQGEHSNTAEYERSHWAGATEYERSRSKEAAL